MVEATAKADAPKFAPGKAPSVAASTEPGKTPSAPAGKPVNTIDPTKAPALNIIQAAPFRIEAMQSRDRWFKALFYGNHGTGKTELAGTAVDVDFMRDVIMLDMEKGQRTIQETPRIVEKDLIDRIEVSAFKTAAHVYDFLKAHCSAREANNIDKMKTLQAMLFGISPNEIHDDPDGIPEYRLRRYRTAIIDTTTELDLYSMSEVMGQDDVAKVLAGDMEVADWPAFRKNNEKVKLLLRSLRDLPMHLIFLAQRKWSQDERKAFHYNPMMTGQLSGQLQSYVDMVGMLRIEEATADNPMPRRLYIQPIQIPGGKFDAKNRRAFFTGAWFDNPTMSSIMRGIGVSKTKPVDADEVRKPDAA